jgi:hypothetical protein
VEFVPQGKIKNVTYDKYNFMDYTNAIFNQGSVWILTVGWTGPDSLTRGGHRGVLQYYTTQRTLLKNNIVLMGNKYVGTL